MRNTAHTIYIGFLVFASVLTTVALSLRMIVKFNNGYVFILARGEMPHDFLKSLGIGFYTQVVE